MVGDKRLFAPSFWTLNSPTNLLRNDVRNDPLLGLPLDVAVRGVFVRSVASPSKKREQSVERSNMFDNGSEDQGDRLPSTNSVEHHV